MLQEVAVLFCALDGNPWHWVGMVVPGLLLAGAWRGIVMSEREGVLRYSPCNGLRRADAPRKFRWQQMRASLIVLAFTVLWSLTVLSFLGVCGIVGMPDGWGAAMG